MPTSVTLTELWIYPIKSLPGLSVDRLSFDSAGPVDDRRWMLVDDKGRFVSQRGMPRLANFRLAVDDDGYRVTAPDGDSVVVPRLSDDGEPVTVTVWKDTVDAFEVGSQWSRWFSDKLDQPVRLVQIGTTSARRIGDPQASDHERVGFADGYPLLVCSEASLAELNQVADLNLDMRRFRPNVVVRGLEPRSELMLGRLTVSSGRIDLVKPCTRCNIPAIDPDTATYQKAVAAQLKAQCEWNGSTVFGANGIARGIEALSIGDDAQFESLA